MSSYNVGVVLFQYLARRDLFLFTSLDVGAANGFLLDGSSLLTNSL